MFHPESTVGRSRRWMQSGPVALDCDPAGADEQSGAQLYVLVGQVLPSREGVIAPTHDQRSAIRRGVYGCLESVAADEGTAALGLGAGDNDCGGTVYGDVFVAGDLYDTKCGYFAIGFGASGETEGSDSGGA